MLTLGIDTSTPMTTVAIMEDGLLKTEFSVIHGRTHSERLIPMIDTLLNAIEKKISDIDLMAVSNGPGSFTGLRIGLAIVKGLSHSTNKPIVLVSSLAAIAYNHSTYPVVYSLIDARRERCYFGKYEFENGICVSNFEDTTMEISSIIEKINKEEKKVLLTGDGVLAYEEFFKDLDNVEFAPKHTLMTRASSICRVAEIEFKKGNITDYTTIDINYLKLSQAQADRVSI